MSSQIDLFGSPGAQSVIALMVPDSRTAVGSRRIAPEGVTRADLRVSASETLQGWFRRVIGENDVAERISQCAINENFAFFGELNWQDGKICQCEFQVLITEGCTLEQFHANESDAIFYYRLDTDLSSLGALFTHPHPHIHALPRDAPRFPFVCRENEFILISFLEFIFLNHFHGSWLRWAERKSTTHISEDAFEEIVFGFERGNVIELWPALENQITNLKDALRIAKRDEVPGAMPIAAICEGLTY